MSAVTVVGITLRASTTTPTRPGAAVPVGVVPSTAQRTGSPKRLQSDPAPPASGGTGSPRLILVAAPAATPQAPPTAPGAHPTRTPTPVTTPVNGQAVDTRCGPVQVQIEVRSGRIWRADVIDYPQGGGRDQEINSQAVPQLDQETLREQSAHIDIVSGATYTSAGYQQSLQSALDAAHKAGAL